MTLGIAGLCSGIVMVVVFYVGALAMTTHRLSHAGGQYAGLLRPRRLFTLAVALTLTFINLPPVHAQPTDITVRVLSRDAKFIGSSMGGAKITLRDAHTGQVLATGLTSGSTGNTGTVMHDKGGRRARLTDNDAAKFVTTLDLDAPTLLEVEAFAPLAQPQSALRVLSSQWVIPGKHLSGGDGWVVEMPGFAVDILNPPAPKRLTGASAEIRLVASVVMMCGCPIEPGGRWDANRFEVRALVERDGEPVTEYPLAYAGEISQFAVNLPLPSPGLYDVTVYAYDPDTGNTGLDRTTFFAP
jgi:hypothetical protein